MSNRSVASASSNSSNPLHSNRHMYMYVCTYVYTKYISAKLKRVADVDSALRKKYIFW